MVPSHSLIPYVIYFWLDTSVYVEFESKLKYFFFKKMNWKMSHAMSDHIC